MTVEPFPITARWRRIYAIRDYAFTLDAKERKKYLLKIIADYRKWLVYRCVSPEKVEQEIHDLERMLREPPHDGGDRVRIAA